MDNEDQRPIEIRPISTQKELNKFQKEMGCALSASVIVLSGLIAFIISQIL